MMIFTGNGETRAVMYGTAASGSVTRATGKETVVMEGVTDFARLATLKAGLKLECRGMRRSKGSSAYAILKSMGYKGSREKVLAAVTADVERIIDEAHAKADAARKEDDNGEPE